MDQKQPISFSLRSDLIIRRVFWSFLGIELFIVFLDVFVNHYKWSSIGAIRRMVNITREDGLANWLSSLQLIIVGSVIWAIAFAVKNQKQNNSDKKRYYCWIGIACFFIYMGFDDAIKFHERIGTTFNTILSRSAESTEPGTLHSIYNAFPSYPWQLIFLPIFAPIGLFILWFLWKELSIHKLGYLLFAAFGLFTLALALDFVEGLESNPYKGIADFFSTKVYRIRHMSKAIEEFFEMFGTTIFLIIFLKKLFTTSQCWKIKIE
ncbi:MAG: hypothetical protein ACUZ8O_16770 [Candidatus Anammoxibacter sp.]